MSNKEETDLLVRTCCLALDDKKAEDISILKLPGDCSIADYFIIASGSSQPHLKALHRSLETALKDVGASILGKERYRPSGWMVIDVFDVVVHVFSRESREFYALEDLWKDSESLDVKRFLPKDKVIAS